MSEDAAVITPSDTAFVDLNGLYIGGTGNLTVITGAGNSVLFTALPVGTQIRNLHIVKVMSTGTTATLIVGFKA
jgi:hypothetical protein